MDEILNGFSEEKYTLEHVFINPSKSFHTVNYKILISKSNVCGFKDKALSWFESYLSERKQCIQVGEQMTSIQDITCGVYQRSILGPLCFCNI